MCEYYSILYMFRIEPSTTVQGAYDVCNKDAVRHDMTARETYLGDGDLVWRGGSTRYIYFEMKRTCLYLGI
jgi:hypothetical protein